MKNYNLTPRAQKLIKEAHKIATDLEYYQLNNVHLLLAFLKIPNNQILDAFDQFEVSYDLVEKACLFTLNKPKLRNSQSASRSKLSSITRKVFSSAKQLSNKYDHKYIGLEHIFLSLFGETDIFLRDVIANLQINYDAIFDYVERKLEESDLLPSSIYEEEADEEQDQKKSQFNPKNYKFLNEYATNLNSQVIQGKITSLHVNKSLIKKISEVLCRKNKNNPLVVGEAGVGKTALVESLAQAIVDGECSDFLVMKHIYNLDVPMIIAGCKYRGEFEEKIKNILKEIVNDPFIVLFIDEIHTIIGAGNPENGMDVANILKPYLARGEISCIGATTFDEYKRTIEGDPALSRRFQMIKMEEPTKKEVFQLIKNIKNSYEDFHLMNFSDETIKFTIDVADKYLEGRFPDKALDIIDQVGAKTKLKNFTKTPEMISIEEKIKDLSSKQDKLAKNTFLKRMNSLIKKYQTITEKLFNKWKDSRYRIKQADILEVVSDKTNIPISDLKKQDSKKIKDLRDSLKTEVLGQTDQIDQIYKCLLRAKAGFRNDKKPVSSLLLAGPTGVGKTMTAKIIANSLFPNKNNFIFLDLTEYTDQTAVNKLIGSSPGYIGYGKGGILTEKVSRNPYSLILFDEIQKAHKDVLYLLLQILEEGKISDSLGKEVDFSNSIVVMTTNIGSDIANSSVIGFNKENSNISNDIVNSVKKHFPADLLNRIDEVIPFSPLKEDHIKSIIIKNLDKFKTEMKNKNLSLNYSSKILDYVYKKIQFNNFGARQVLKTVQREIQTLVAEKILDNPKTSELKMCVKNNKICVI
jgi:ATP-dependent Clp protease ATP-binding subunit ClpC